MGADVVQRRRAQEGVDDGVSGDVGVAVARQATLEGDLHAGDDQTPALHQRVGVVPDADSQHGYSFARRRRKSSARGRSSGVVTLMFS